MDPQVLKALQGLADDPTYQLLQSYLLARRSMPEFAQGILPKGTRGEFSVNTAFGSDLPANGRLTLSPTVLEQPQLSENKATLLHELTHAVNRQLTEQYFETKRAASGLLKSPSTSKFTEAYDKLLMQPSGDSKAPKDTSGVMAVAQSLSPAWLAENRDYRASYPELPAFAVGNAAAKVPTPGYQVPQHLDPTLATEQSILIAQALKEMLARPQSQGR